MFKHKIKGIFFLLLPALFLISIGSSDTNNESYVLIQQVSLEENNIKSWFINTGIFNQDLRVANTPGFEWPAGSNKFAIFSTGFSIAAYINGQLREAMASYKGEFAPGYIADSAGLPNARTDSRFKIYSVRRTDNWINNPDWLNWGLMVPYGAPYIDVNHSGNYEYMIDTPGVINASQTIFCCLTDGFPEEHKIGEGFGGGTLPIYAESHLTAWAYDLPGLRDVQFLRWSVINKNIVSWNSAFFAIVCDPDLGFGHDDYTGCDTIRNMGYCYNGDNNDDGGSYSYGINPPAVGFDLLMGAVNKNTVPNRNYHMSSFSCILNANTGSLPCETDPNGEPEGAYRFLRGVKKDGTPWVIPRTSPPQITRYCYSGDPETNTGWTEAKGCVLNCGGTLYGNLRETNPLGDRKFVLSSGADNFTVNPGDTQTIIIAQFIARGTNYLNSVTRLKQFDDSIQAFFNNNFPIGVNEISSTVPDEFVLYQNYPNPFNPATKIKYSIPLSRGVSAGRGVFTRLAIYDILGKEVAVLINKELEPGTYEVDWNASNYPSGVYFYTLSTQVFSQTRKMVLIK